MLVRKDVDGKGFVVREGVDGKGFVVREKRCCG